MLAVYSRVQTQFLGDRVERKLRESLRVSLGAPRNDVNSFVSKTMNWVSALVLWSICSFVGSELVLGKNEKCVFTWPLTRTAFCFFFVTTLTTRWFFYLSLLIWTKWLIQANVNRNSLLCMSLYNCWSWLKITYITGLYKSTNQVDWSLIFPAPFQISWRAHKYMFIEVVVEYQ